MFKITYDWEWLAYAVRQYSRIQSGVSCVDCAKNDWAVWCSEVLGVTRYRWRSTFCEWHSEEWKKHIFGVHCSIKCHQMQLQTDTHTPSGVGNLRKMFRQCNCTGSSACNHSTFNYATACERGTDTNGWPPSLLHASFWSALEVEKMHISNNVSVNKINIVADRQWRRWHRIIESSCVQFIT